MLYDYVDADDEWEFYVGKLFSNIIKEFYNNKLNTVVEIAPGFRYKIAYALRDINFCGTIYVVDANVKVVNYIEETYKTILPNAKIVGISKELKNCFEDLPKNIDLLLSNHVIDDLLIGEYIKKDKESDLPYKEYLLKAWENLSKDKNKRLIVNSVYSVFEKMFKSKNIKFILLSQYKSNLYFKLNKASEKLTKTCFNKIKKLVTINKKQLKKALNFYPFGEDERYKGKELLNNTQNHKNWIVGYCKNFK